MPVRFVYDNVKLCPKKCLTNAKQDITMRLNEQRRSFSYPKGVWKWTPFLCYLELFQRRKQTWLRYGKVKSGFRPDVQ